MTNADDIQRFLATFPPDEENGVELRVDPERETVWATTRQITDLYGSVDESGVIKHIKNIFADQELEQSRTTAIFAVVRTEGGRTVSRNIIHYNLDIILSVGYRVNSKTATKFRQWATKTLSSYLVSGYVVNEERLAHDLDAQRRLAISLRKVRTSEMAMYEKVRAVFKLSASDYEPTAQAAKTFFAMAQDKFHYAVTQKTAAEIVLERADASKPSMGLLTLKGEHPTTQDITVAKNYLNDEELHSLENISEQFLLFAESKAFRRQKMTMEELSFKLNTLLTANDYPVLYEYGEYKRSKADEHAQRQYALYQQRLGEGGTTKRKQLGTGK